MDATAADVKEIRKRAIKLKDEMLDFMSVFVPMNDREQRFYDSCLTNLVAIRNLAVSESWDDVAEGLEFLEAK